MKKVLIEINPLKFSALEQEFKKNNVSINTLLGALVWPHSDHTIEAVIDRYNYITRKNPLKFAPAENNILEKIVWPLRQSKVCFLLSNYIGTISICGFIAEMICILYFNISDVRVNNKKISEDDQRKLYGDLFENLGQARRINILYGMKMIEKTIYDLFLEIKCIRNKYLHFFSNDHTEIKQNAKRIFNQTERLVTEIIGQKIEKDRFFLNPEILEYIKDNTPEQK